MARKKPSVIEVSNAWKLTEAKPDLIKLFMSLNDAYIRWQSTRGKTPLGSSQATKKELISILGGCFWTSYHLFKQFLENEYHQESAEKQGFPPIKIKEYTDLFSTMDIDSTDDVRLNRMVTVYMEWNARDGYMSLSETSQHYTDWRDRVSSRQ